MNFGLTEDQEHLRVATRKFLEEQCPIQEVRRLMREPDGTSAKLWHEIARLGWTGLTIPETHGGAGLGWIDLIVLLEETGRSLLPLPLISTVLTSSVIADIGSHDQKERLLPELASGDAIGALAIFDDPDTIAPPGISTSGRVDGDELVLHGRKSHAIDAGRADFLIVGYRDANDVVGLAIVPRDAAGVTVEAVETLDETKRMGHVTLDDVRLPLSARIGDADDAWHAIERAMDRAAIATTAEILGAAQAAHELTVQYAKDRVQFGSPIGRFQGVKHPLAEMYVDLESTRSLLYYAAWALEEASPDSSSAASQAKAFATEAFLRIGVGAIQIHGAVGYTEEYDIQLYLKRSKWARPVYGDENHHLDRVATLGGI